jgi:hypothetical protein
VVHDRVGYNPKSRAKARLPWKLSTTEVRLLVVVVSAAHMPPHHPPLVLGHH